MTQAPPKPRRWLLAVDPRVYHWDTLFVKGKEMWRHAGSRPDAARQLKQVHKGDRTLCYHGKPVWVGQISRDIGVRFTWTSPILVTHKIDPDVDETGRGLFELDQIGSAHRRPLPAAMRLL